MAEGYDKLAKSIANLGTAVATLDVEKLNAFKNLNSSIVLMSFIDPDQVEKVLDAIEKRTGVYLKVFEDVEKKSSGKIGSSGSINTTSNKQNTATLDDVLEAIKQNGQIGVAMVNAVKSGNSSILDELRMKSSGNSIKNRGK
jgi:MoaA/NifB/PqqE/SkfB family radical SAM enzyme